MPQPDETLDFPAYEPPKPGRLTFVVLMIAISVVLLASAAFLGTWALLSRKGPGSHKVPTVTFVLELGLACENFRLENGRYPWAKPDSVTASTEIRGRDVYVELRALPGAEINTTQDYLGEVPKRLVKNGAPVDIWGREIMFRVDPKTGKPVIWSCGRDGRDDTNDGPSPDPAKFPKTYYWFSTGQKSDDLTNR